MLTVSFFPPPRSQRKLREISTKFQLFQKPANFEQRMLDCKRVLDGAKAELHVLDVSEVEPEKIQERLSGCMVRCTHTHTDTSTHTYTHSNPHVATPNYTSS